MVAVGHRRLQARTELLVGVPAVGAIGGVGLATVGAEAAIADPLDDDGETEGRSTCWLRLRTCPKRGFKAVPQAWQRVGWQSRVKEGGWRLRAWPGWPGRAPFWPGEGLWERFSGNDWPGGTDELPEFLSEAGRARRAASSVSLATSSPSLAVSSAWRRAIWMAWEATRASRSALRASSASREGIMLPGI